MSRFAVRIEKLARALTQRARAPGEIKRLVVMHHLLLGDTVLLAPLLKTLQALAPGAERYVLVRPAFLPIFEKQPYGFKAIAFARGDAQSQRRLFHSGPYDLAIVPDDNRYAWLARACGARHIVGFAQDRPAWKNWMIDHPVPYPAAPMAWADMLPGLVDADAPAHFRVGEWPAPSHAPFDVPRGPYAVLHVGASSVLKTWSTSRWQAIAAKLRERGLQIVWSGAENERGILDQIAAPSTEVGLFGQLDLAQLWHLLAKARTLICPDTGIAHLARLTGVPTVALFGPGSALIHGAGAFWSQQAFFTLTQENFPCRDQHILYRRQIDWVRRCGRGFGTEKHQCPRALCMAAVGIEPVWNTLQSILEPLD